MVSKRAPAVKSRYENALFRAAGGTAAFHDMGTGPAVRKEGVGTGWGAGPDAPPPGTSHPTKPAAPVEVKDEHSVLSTNKQALNKKRLVAAALAQEQQKKDLQTNGNGVAAAAASGMNNMLPSAAVPQDDAVRSPPPQIVGAHFSTFSRAPPPHLSAASSANRDSSSAPAGISPTLPSSRAAHEPRFAQDEPKVLHADLTKAEKIPRKVAKGPQERPWNGYEAMKEVVADVVKPIDNWAQGGSEFCAKHKFSAPNFKPRGYGDAPSAGGRRTDAFISRSGASTSAGRRPVRNGTQTSKWATPAPASPAATASPVASPAPAAPVPTALPAASAASPSAPAQNRPSTPPPPASPSTTTAPPSPTTRLGQLAAASRASSSALTPSAPSQPALPPSIPVVTATAPVAPRPSTSTSRYAPRPNPTSQQPQPQPQPQLQSTERSRNGSPVPAKGKGKEVELPSKGGKAEVDEVEKLLGSDERGLSEGERQKEEARAALLSSNSAAVSTIAARAESVRPKQPARGQSPASASSPSESRPNSRTNVRDRERDGGRNAAGGGRQKRTPEEIDALMAEMKRKNEETKKRLAAAEADRLAFESVASAERQRSAELQRLVDEERERQKKAECEKRERTKELQRLIDAERARSAELKLARAGGRQWDAEKLTRSSSPAPPSPSYPSAERTSREQERERELSEREKEEVRRKDGVREDGGWETVDHDGQLKVDGV
ncbi:hypothetical protein JCM10213_001646 [Rhodosporidiobolus nylandii]